MAAKTRYRSRTGWGFWLAKLGSSGDLICIRRPIDRWRLFWPSDANHRPAWVGGGSGAPSFAYVPRRLIWLRFTGFYRILPNLPALDSVLTVNFCFHRRLTLMDSVLSVDFCFHCRLTLMISTTTFRVKWVYWSLQGCSWSFWLIFPFFCHVCQVLLGFT